MCAGAEGGGGCGLTLSASSMTNMLQALRSHTRLLHRSRMRPGVATMQCTGFIRRMMSSFKSVPPGSSEQRKREREKKQRGQLLFYESAFHSGLARSFLLPVVTMMFMAK